MAEATSDPISGGRPFYSVVIPVYNEEESLEPLFREISETMKSLNRDFEVIFINDYSSDSSLSILERFKRQFPATVNVISLSQRSGQTFCLRQGLNAAQGDVVMTMDADMQNDPADIPRMLKKLEEGADCVCGWRKAREDTPLKAGLSKFGNILQRTLTGLKIHDVSCTLRVYQRDCVDKIALNWEGQHRFIPLSLSLQGYKIAEVVSHHRQRKFGRSKYSHKRIFRVMVDFFRVLAARGRK
ncbi:MAG TPA: glycosyltransferase [Candidatus Omnitrophica bacterium]|nr:MAG: hypothetical protein A2Z81_03650 [Omnitrophica WOR_2 bacterium GWA2_45_18]HBR15797.1 glycosyltransferase [Candidatus Omnitrophota bacterium]